MSASSRQVYRQFVANHTLTYWTELEARVFNHMLYAGVMAVPGELVVGTVPEYQAAAKSKKAIDANVAPGVLSTFVLTRNAVHALLIDIAARFGNIPITVEMRRQENYVVYQVNGDRFTHSFLGTNEIQDEKVYEHWKDEVLLKLFLYLEDTEDDE